ncbi:MAG: ASKHA domain-containing protein [Methanospirillum sp.]
MDSSPLTLVVQPSGRVVAAQPGDLLLDLVRETGLLLESICGGAGECGKCRVVVTPPDAVEETGGPVRHALPPDERAQGYVLACRARVVADCTVTVPVESRIVSPKILVPALVGEDDLDPAVRAYPVSVEADPFSIGTSVQLAGYRGPRPRIDPVLLDRLRASTGDCWGFVHEDEGSARLLRATRSPGPLYGLAVDLGTTTVVGALVDLATGRVVATGAALNRQITWGEELLTRCAFGRKEAGRETLRRAAAESIELVVRAATAEAGVEPAAIAEIVLAGNTVMTWLAAGRDPAPLELVDAPVDRGFVRFDAGELGLSVPPGTPVVCLPAISRFVGGDVVGDLLTAGLCASDEVSLLVDLGTNGEIVLGCAEWRACTSCASGPAFEGGGCSSGMRAMDGAIERVSFDSATGAIEWSAIGGGRPRGLCGSGIIDAAYAMYRAGVLDFTGKLVEGAPGVRRGRDGLEFVLVPPGETATGRAIAITEQDMAYLMDSKAAVLGAVAVLLERYRVRPADVRHLYLAGAFGAYADLASVSGFGILPHLPNAAVHALGNGSLAGAYAALVSRARRREAATCAASTAYIDLLVDPAFVEAYTAALQIPGPAKLFAKE